MCALVLSLISTRPQPNQRLKLTARGGRLKGTGLSCLRPPQAAA